MTKPDITPEGIEGAVECFTDGWHVVEFDFGCLVADKENMVVFQALPLIKANFISYARNALPLIAEQMRADRARIAELEEKIADLQNEEFERNH